MPRVIVWHCDHCHSEARGEKDGRIVIKEFRHDRPKFYSFCDWGCLSAWFQKNLVAGGEKCRH